ncbi:MAG: cell division protein FtsA [bacterium]|nr:cell division protein FtsA [bacterium]
MAEKDIIVGLDIGTTKICVIIAEKGKFEEIKILGVGTSPSHGLRRGVVINIDKTCQSIQKAVQDAERMAGVEVKAVYAGIAGDHIRSLNSRGIVAVSRENNEIQTDDVDRAIDAAKAISMPIDREIIHILPQQYIIDDQDGILEPIGMSGVRLEVEAHIVTGAITSAQNIYKSVERACYSVHDLVLEPLASSFAVLEDDEKELGIGLIDIGGGTTDVALFFEKSIRFTKVISLGGNHVTNDIAIGLRTPPEQAEKIKIDHGCCFLPNISEEEYIQVPSVAGREPRKVSRTILTRIIQPRMEEIFTLAYREIKKSDVVELLTSGLVLTGGCCLIPGAVELAEEIFDMPVRLGIPKGIVGIVDTVKNPMYATGVGLVLYGDENRSDGEQYRGDDEQIYNTIIDKFKNIISDFF